MKILNTSQLREADAFTITHEGIRSVDLMERAAEACVLWITARYSKKQRFVIFSGTGNNGGDGLAIARMLNKEGYEVLPYIIRHSGDSSEDCRINEARLMQADLSLVRNVFSLDDIGDAIDDAVIIDALFGTGLSRPLSGLAGDIAEYINATGSDVISIDMPSGLFADEHSGSGQHVIVKATYTLTFGTMKRAFMFPESQTFTGDITVLDIGLNKEFIADCNTESFITTPFDVSRLVAKRQAFSHKGSFGHALLVCGSRGKAGAAVLAARACLRSGAGLLSIHIPGRVVDPMTGAVPEAMSLADPDDNLFTTSPATDAFDALGVGCGLGTADETARALKLLIQGYRYPTVFDADALNILAANKTWMEFIPPGSIFTPHHKEFERLAGKAGNDFERNEMQRAFATKYKIYVVLKGRYTAIACPDGTCYFNPTGNPGMATGGAGDVLTGILTGLLAQGFSSKEAALCGVYLHGLAGDEAAAALSQQALIASDITDFLGHAYRTLAGQIKTFKAAARPKVEVTVPNKFENLKV